MTRWSLLLQTPSSSYTTSWDSTVAKKLLNDFGVDIQASSTQMRGGLGSYDSSIQVDPIIRTAVRLK